MTLRALRLLVLAHQLELRDLVVIESRPLEVHIGRVTPRAILPERPRMAVLVAVAAQELVVSIDPLRMALVAFVRFAELEMKARQREARVLLVIEGSEHLRPALRVALETLLVVELSVMRVFMRVTALA